MIERLRSRVYVAAPLELREVASEVARELHSRGFRVVSTWHEIDGLTRASEGGAKTWEVRRAFAANEHEIGQADAMVALSASAGRETLVEIGIALARGLRVIALDRIKLASYRRERVTYVPPQGDHWRHNGAIVAALDAY